MTESAVCERHQLKGLISSAGFASGHRIVVGMWKSGPLGPMNDVMWARPDGTRVLLAPSQAIADFITAVYEFDEVQIADVVVQLDRSGRKVSLSAGPLTMELVGGQFIPIPFGYLRRPWFTRLVERPISRALMNVSTFGITPRGIHEWYRADGLRYVRSATASLDGEDLGVMAAIDPPLNMGVSDPPKRPSMVKVRPLLFDPTGHLDAVLRVGRGS